MRQLSQLLVEDGKEIYVYNGRRFLLEDISIPREIVAPLNLEKKDLPEYDMLDRKHYDAAQFHYFEDRRWLWGCEEHREIKEEEISREIGGPLRDAFHWCYFQRFKKDRTKVKVCDVEEAVAI